MTEFMAVQCFEAHCQVRRVSFTHCTACTDASTSHSRRFR